MDIITILSIATRARDRERLTGGAVVHERLNG